MIRVQVPVPQRPEDGKRPEGNLIPAAVVSRLLGVDPKTVTRWAKAGKLTSVRTLGGHRRYYESEVMALIEASRQDRS